MRIYYTTSNNGDGSSSVEFFSDKECIGVLEEANPESYAGGEGGGYFDFEGSITNIDIASLADVLAEIREDS